MKNRSEFYKELSEKYSLPPFVIQGIIQHQYTFIKKNLQDPKLPCMFVHGLGRFEVKNGRLEWMARLLLNKLKKTKINREELKENIYNLLQIRRKRKNGIK